MTAQRLSLISKLMMILAIYLAFLPSIIVYVQPVLMQASDYLMTFYPAGKLASLGRIAEIYTPAGMTTFIGAPFDKFVHESFPAIPRQNVAIYMYSPLIALFFAPFSLVAAQFSLIAWQLVNVFASALVSLLFARPALLSKLQDVGGVFLFCPVFISLLIGQLGLLFGLVPLALAYYLMLLGRELAAGFVLGLLYMKPQFLPLALLVCGALFFARRPKATLGLFLGLGFMCLLTVLLCGAPMFHAFIDSIKMSDSCYSNGGYKPPVALIVCLPAVILQCFPMEMRESVKLGAYGLSALVGLFALFHTTKIFRGLATLDSAPDSALNFAQKQKANQKAIAIVFMLGLLVLPLVVPHFLYYDLCALAMFTYIARQSFWSKAEAFYIAAICRLIYISANIYFVLFMFTTASDLGQWLPFLLVLALAIMFGRCLKLSATEELFAVKEALKPAE